MPHSFPLCFSPTPLQQRAAVVAGVMALHTVLVAAWLTHPSPTHIPAHEMEISVTMQDQAVRSTIQAVPLPLPVRVISPPATADLLPQPRIETALASQPADAVIQQENIPMTASSEPISAAVAAPASVLEAEPDYQAAYLDNRLIYPLAARRMGLQGRVVLNVEVLAEGMSGQMNVHLSSGHEALDRAALESVKKWRFIPAQRGGQPYTRWFKIPIRFSLEDRQA